MEIKDEDKFCEDYFMNLSEAFFTLKNNLWQQVKKSSLSFCP
jgi:hypothetical protein